MRRAGVIAAVLAVVVVLWWIRRGDRAPATTARPSRDAPPDRVRVTTSPDAAIVRRGAPDAGAGAVAAAPDAGTKDEPAPPAIRPLAEVAAEAAARLREAARPCSDDRGAGQAITFRYVLVIAGGRARIDDVVTVSSDVVEPDVEDCVVAAIDALAWDARGAPDSRLGVQASLRLDDVR